MQYSSHSAATQQKWLYFSRGTAIKPIWHRWAAGIQSAVFILSFPYQPAALKSSTFITDSIFSCLN
jgi:hypothetical protein